MHLGVDRVNRHGFHFDKQIVLAGLRHRRGDFNERAGIRRINGNGFN
jgi:hypothetical protein